MFQIAYMPDADRFLEIVNTCKGEVLLCLPDDTYYNLKENRTAQQMLKLMTQNHKHVNLSFRLSDEVDVPRFMRYMMEAAA